MSAGVPPRDETSVRRHLLHATLRITIYAVALFALYALAPLGRRRDGWIVVELLLALTVLALVVLWQILAIIRSPFPRLQALETVAISVPLLIVSFAATYVELGEGSPGSFTQPINRIDGVYFTVTVLATVGFGDIAPTSDAARLVVTGQMIADLVLVGLIARVIFGAVQHRRQALVTELEEHSDAPGGPRPQAPPNSSRAGDVRPKPPLQSYRRSRR